MNKLFVNYIWEEYVYINEEEIKHENFNKLDPSAIIVSKGSFDKVYIISKDFETNIYVKKNWFKPKGIMILTVINLNKY